MYHRGELKSFVDLGQTTRYNKGLQSIPEAIDVSFNACTGRWCDDNVYFIIAW